MNFHNLIGNLAAFFITFMLNIMRKIAFVILLIGAVGSFGLVLNAGRHSPVLLLVLFIGWVLSPYIALFLVHVVSKLQLIIAPKLLYCLMLFVSLGSLASYGITLIQHRTKSPTGVYLSVPFISWFLIVIAIAITAYRKRKLLKKIEV